MPYFLRESWMPAPGLRQGMLRRHDEGERRPVDGIRRHVVQPLSAELLRLLWPAALPPW
jgi:hypothetical protein